MILASPNISISDVYNVKIKLFDGFEKIIKTKFNTWIVILKGGQYINFEKYIKSICISEFINEYKELTKYFIYDIEFDEMIKQKFMEYFI